MHIEMFQSDADASAVIPKTCWKTVAALVKFRYRWN